MSMGMLSMTGIIPLVAPRMNVARYAIANRITLKIGFIIVCFLRRQRYSGPTEYVIPKTCDSRQHSVVEFINSI